jgi:hypothetical protein
MDQAVDAIERINADYPHHCKAARRVAEKYLSAPKIGAALLKQLGL